MRSIPLFIALLLITSCKTSELSVWPSTLPDRQYFISLYDVDSGNQVVQTEEQYLLWVINFYEGTLIAPMGWLAMQNIVVERAKPIRRPELKASLETLGGRIAGEWSKANDQRVIDSRMLSVWGSIIELVFEADVQDRALKLISNDVSALLARDLLGSELTDSYYEQRLGLELFSGF